MNRQPLPDITALRLTLHTLDLPTFTNGGLIVLGLLILALAAMLVPHPCPWRCPDCTARFPRLEQLLAHEARHRHPAYLLADLTREESAS